MHVILAVLALATLKTFGRGIGMDRAGLRRLGMVVALIVVGATLVVLTRLVDLPGMLRAMHGG